MLFLHVKGTFLLPLLAVSIKKRYLLLDVDPLFTYLGIHLMVLNSFFLMICIVHTILHIELNLVSSYDFKFCKKLGFVVEGENL